MSPAFLALAAAPVLDTAHRKLRAPKPSELDAWSAFPVSPRGAWHGGGPGHGIGRALRIVATLLGHWAIHGFGVPVAEGRASARRLGSVEPFFPADRPERELGWSRWDEPDDGRGHATEAAVEALRHCAVDPDLPALVSCVDPANTRSDSLAELPGATPDERAARPPSGGLVVRHRMSA